MSYCFLRILFVVSSEMRFIYYTSILTGLTFISPLTLITPHQLTNAFWSRTYGKVYYWAFNTEWVRGKTISSDRWRYVLPACSVFQRCGYAVANKDNRRNNDLGDLEALSQHPGIVIRSVKLLVASVLVQTNISEEAARTKTTFEEAPGLPNRSSRSRG